MLSKICSNGRYSKNIFSFKMWFGVLKHRIGTSSMHCTFIFLSNFDQNRTRSYINNDQLQEFILKEAAVPISVDSSVPAILPLGVRIQNTISLLFSIDMDILVTMASWKPRFGPFLEQKMYFACPFH